MKQIEHSVLFNGSQWTHSNLKTGLRSNRNMVLEKSGYFTEDDDYAPSGDNEG